MNTWTSFENNYDVRHLVFRDDVSTTYTARRKSDGKTVAARKFLLFLLGPTERLAVDNEISILQKISHPNVPAYKEIRFSNDSKIMYVITAYVQSETLACLISDARERGTHIEEKTIWGLIADLLDLLQFILLPHKQYFADDEHIDFISLDPREIMVDKSKKLYVRSFTYARNDGPERIVEKTSLYDCYVPGASFSTIEQRNLYLIGLLIYELCLLTPYNYYSPIGPWPSCPAEQVFFPLHTRELCTLCKSLLDITKKPRLGLSDLIDMPQIRDVHPTFAAEVAESLNQQTELISSRYNTDCESFLTRGPSYLSALKHNASDCSLAAEDTTPQGIDRGSVDLHNIFTAPIESLSVNRNAKSIPEPVSTLAPKSARPASPSRILVDTGQLTPILPRQYLDESKRSASSPPHPKREHRQFEYLANYPFIKKPSYQIVDTPTTLMKAAIAGDEDLARLSINDEAGCALKTGETALYYALLHRNYQIADMLLNIEGVAVNDDTFSESVVRNQERAFIYGDDRTPLISAAMANDLIGVYSLIPFYARFQDAQGKTALMHAIEHGHSEVACLLARSEHGLVDSSGVYATLFSILHNNPVVFKALYIKESGLLKGDGFTPLMISAALDGKASISSQLQRYKAMRTKRGLTAMMVAVHCSESLDILHELVKHEAGIRDEKGDTALMHAIHARKEPAVRLLAKFEGTLADASGKTALMRAALEGFSQAIPLLQSQARKADNEGKTALMHAIESGNITAAAMLATMEAGARDSSGETALIKALRYELPAIAKLLIPLETKYTDLSGNYASRQAILQGHRALLELLVPHELELLYNDGFTELMIAVASFNMTIARKCLSRDVSRQTKSGLTALMIAVLVGNKQVIPFLLEERHLVDETNQKAVDYARRLNEIEVIKLLDEGAEIDLFTKESQSLNKTQAADTDQIHRSSVLITGYQNSGEDRLSIGVIKEESQPHTLSPRNEHLSHMVTATPQALVSMERTATHADTICSFSSSTELLKPIRSPPTARSANTSVFSNGSTGNKSFNSLRRTIEMDKRYDGYEPEARRSSARLPKRPISAVPTKPVPTANPWGATTIDFTTLSLEMDSVSSDFPDATRVQSPGMDMADLSCEEFAIQKTGDAQQAKMIPVDKPGCNPLLSAVLTNDVAASARNLNYSGAQFGKSKKTALIVAADRGNTEIVRLLEPSEAGQATTSGWTALMRAAVHNHVDCVSILIKKETGLLNHRSMSALMIATELGHIEVVSRLAPLEAGLRNANYYTALMLAAKRGYTEIVEILAPHEANYTRSNGATALMYAIQNRHTSCVRILADYEAGRRLDNGWTALMMAAQNGFLDAVELLKSYEGKMQNVNGSTALMLAAQNKRLAAVKLLLSTEAAMTNCQGATALMMASENGSVAICQMLEPCERGIMTNNGSTALMFAARAGNTEIASLLLNSEAGRQSGVGHSALMLAAQAGAIEVCSLLLKKEQCLRTQDGTTALMMAARAGHHTIVELLAPHEAGARRNDGVTARIIALSKGHAACVQLLERFEP
ncbi:Serine/threonine-protein kinase NEK [Giardia duodenalis]|uniref:Serine/threonine-protein kinase NEK n=1 Tax=Giardia intestinalis TaxID=5741 RepID=V6TGH7_GIAIN|nr:Serine/threonine-protein kinase NEK [Giardia intestinalis]